MSMPAVKRYTVEEYLELELSSETKHEFFDGEIYAMAGGSPNHNRIQVNLATAAGTRLRGGSCRFYLSETRVHVAGMGLYTYPDASVVCGKALIDGSASSETILNPKVIFEILSPTTEGYDRGKKFKLYSAIESLTDYILVAQDEPWVLHFTRLDGGDWQLSQTASLDGTVLIPSIACELPMGEIYLDVEFAPRVSLREQTVPISSRPTGGGDVTD